MKFKLTSNMIRILNKKVFMIVLYILAIFKWLLSTGLTFAILFLGIGIWTNRLIKIKELRESSNLTQVGFKVSLCLMPFIIATVSYPYMHYLSQMMTPPPEGHSEYIAIEKMIQPYLSIGMGFIASAINFRLFIFTKDKVESAHQLK